MIVFVELARRIEETLDPSVDPMTERLVFGDLSSQEIAREVEAWCASVLTRRVVDAWLWSVSVSCVAGLTLDDGRSVVVKAHPPNRSVERLAATLDVQQRVADAGLPSPRPCSELAPLGRGWAFAQQAITDGRRPDMRRAIDRRTAAAAWMTLTATLAQIAPPTTVWDEQPARVIDGLYPQPHSPIFDFEATSPGAEWIDELANDALTVTSRLEAVPVLVHTDWRPDNLRVSDDGTTMVAIYDWDSLRRHIEPAALGEVSATHSIDLSSASGPHFASGAECLAFATDAETARKFPYTDAERAAIRAAIVYGWCYTARCEHARASIGDERPHFGMRNRLHLEGRRLLSTTR